MLESHFARTVMKIATTFLPSSTMSRLSIPNLLVAYAAAIVLPSSFSQQSINIMH
jgi:hypothetical protein